MRGWDVALIIIFMEMSIGFLGVLTDDEAHSGGALFLLPNHTTSTIYYFSPEDNQYIKQYQNSNATDAIKDSASINPLTFIMDWILNGWAILSTVITAFAAISLVLIRQFHLDWRLAMFIQGIIYLMYTWMFIQWRSGRGGRAFE